MMRNLAKRAVLATDKLLILVLVVFVVITVLIMMFRVDINNFIRNLPGYSLPEDDEIDPSEIDEGVEDSCTEIGKINAPEKGGKQRIYFIEEKTKLVATNLYWDADEEEGEIKIWGENVEVAEIENGKVSVNLAFFDFDSVEHQEIRFVPGVDVSYLAKLHNSYYFGSNFICAGDEEEIEIDYGWPEEPIVLSTIDLDLEKIRKKLKVDFSPYMTILDDSCSGFLYFKARGEYIEIMGNVLGLFGADWTAIDYRELGKIYPDGSVWLDRERLTKECGVKLSGVDTKYRETYPLYHESNLRIDYTAVRSLLE